MKWLPLTLLLFTNSIAFAGPQTFGAGVVLGEPTALTGKLWHAEKEAIDFGFGYWFDDYFLFYGDYLWHFDRFNSQHSFFNHMQAYVGVGGSIFLSTSSPGVSRNRNRSDSVSLALRIPVGVEWRPGDPSIGLFLEVVPLIDLIPGITAGLGAGIGGRYYF